MTDSPQNVTDTYFAPAGRAEVNELRCQMDDCLNSPLAQVVLKSLGGYVAVLNEQRQILAANETLIEALAAQGNENVLGRRWGEAMNCIHALEGPDGCGTSRACSCCGGAISMLAAQNGDHKAEAECRMAMRRNGVWQGREFRATASQIEIDSRKLLVMVFHDISDAKRRQNLESTFLHDLANTVLVLNGWSTILTTGHYEEKAAQKIVDIANRLSEVVHDQRILIQAELGYLSLHLADVNASEFLASLALTLRAHPSANGKEIKTDAQGTVGKMLRTDPSLLFRILLNMGINALEASDPGETIRLRFRYEDGHPIFSVQNPSVIPDEVALQIFHRSFSTKAKSGRGLGTHSMKILGENFLKGKVSFVSTPETGTVFSMRFPVES